MNYKKYFQQEHGITNFLHSKRLIQRLNNTRNFRKFLSVNLILSMIAINKVNFLSRHIHNAVKYTKFGALGAGFAVEILGQKVFEKVMKGKDWAANT